jgi:Ca2+-binding EF-hand superfamily protein
MRKFGFLLIFMSAIMMSSVSMAQQNGQRGQDGQGGVGGQGGQGGQGGFGGRGGRGGQGGQGGGRGGRGGRGGGPPGGEGFGGQPPASPFMLALDTDKDGQISKEEIANAATALLTMDKNGDGILNAEEVAPPQRGRGGPGGGFGDSSAMVDRFMQRDTDGDGSLSKDEAGERMANAFGTYDTDSNELLSKDEIESMIKSWTGGGRGGRGGGSRQPKTKDSRPKFEDG